jgi:hypothetical protein
MYDTKACNDFVADMERAGLKVRHYEGRFQWQGPAVVVPKDRVGEVLRATSVELQTDNMGLGMVVYPRISGRLMKGESASALDAGKPRRR